MKKIQTLLIAVPLVSALFITSNSTAQPAKPKAKQKTSIAAHPAKAKALVVATPAKTAVPEVMAIPSLQIGSQTWTLKNLEVTMFANGDKIEQAQSAEDWIKAGNEGRPAWCYYENDADKGKTFGVLYNWFAIGDSRGLAPKGWHVASKYEWIPMLEAIGGMNVGGNKLKSKTFWEPIGGPDRNGYDSLGFNALPGGLRFEDGRFGMIGERCQFWTSTENNSEMGALVFFGIMNDVEIGRASKKFGYSVRCVKD